MSSTLLSPAFVRPVEPRVRTAGRRASVTTTPEADELATLFATLTRLLDDEGARAMHLAAAEAADDAAVLAVGRRLARHATRAGASAAFVTADAYDVDVASMVAARAASARYLFACGASLELARACGRAVLVAVAGQTVETSLKRAIARHERAGVPLLGVVLADARRLPRWVGG